MGKAKPHQLELVMPVVKVVGTWGGKRKGAGRPKRRMAPGEKRPGAHMRRPWIDFDTVAHVTLRTVA
ncbi:MAG: hypothetical protein H7247_10205, partial [Polaromonas sp.]|nr:hypothetical protein [Gemmatimonadaceae bacterium]